MADISLADLGHVQPQSGITLADLARRSPGRLADLLLQSMSPQGLSAPQRPSSPNERVSQGFDSLNGPAGVMEHGNIDTANRPVVRNPDGSISTVRSMSANFGKGEVVMPTISDDGRTLSEAEAIDQYRRTGRHLGIFDTPDRATSFAKQLSAEQARRYGR